MSFSFINEDNNSMWKMTGTRACTSQKNVEKFEPITIENIEHFNESIITFTLYYADWCPHCTHVKPVFRKYIGNGIKKVNGKKVIVRMIEEKQMTPDSPRIPGFPSFILETEDGLIVPFNGRRTPTDWDLFLDENI